MKNCVAKWDAHQCSTPIHLWLRNNIFYCRMELPRINGKRRYKRISLHTDNYYEAREKLRYMAITFDQKISKKMRLKGLVKSFPTRKELIQMRDDAIREYNEEYAAIHPGVDFIDAKENTTNLSVNNLQQLFSAFTTDNRQAPKHTIQEIFNAMLLKANNKKASNIRKKNMLEGMLKKVGLSWKDDYSKLHDVKVIEQISRNVLSLTDIKNGGKKSRLACIKELVTCACNIEPDFYKSNVIANLPNIKKDSIKTVKGHLPYSKDQLLNIFSPEHPFFEQNPDCFWICMIGLFTGSRANAAITLQYDDIINESGIDCIHFQSNHQAKQLKNDASERKVPIHKQLLDLGFVEYVKRKKAKTKATGTDFIFDDAVTKKNQEYNNKYILRTITPFLKEIGVKKDNKDGYDFHSFRKTISIALQDTGIPNSYINDIIGWTPDNTMEQSYSNHTLAQIKEQLDKFEYEFLKLHFDKWKTIMSKKS